MEPDCPWSPFPFALVPFVLFSILWKAIFRKEAASPVDSSTSRLLGALKPTEGKLLCNVCFLIVNSQYFNSICDLYMSISSPSFSFSLSSFSSPMTFNISWFPNACMSFVLSSLCLIPFSAHRDTWTRTGSSGSISCPSDLQINYLFSDKLFWDLSHNSEIKVRIPIKKKKVTSSLIQFTVVP